MKYTQKVKKLFLNLCLLTIIYNLMVLPVHNIAVACSYPNDPDLKAAKASCDAQSGMEWNCGLNRCQYSQDTQDTRDEYADCANIQDVAERQQCMEDNAREQAEAEGVGGRDDPDEAGEAFAQGVYGTCLGLAIINSIAAYGSEGESSCACKNWFILAALFGVINEILIYEQTEEELVDLAKEYEAKMVVYDDSDKRPEDAQNLSAYETQLAAYQYLRDEQKVIQSIGRTKNERYTILAVMYGIALIAALYDLFSGSYVCQNENTSPLNIAQNFNFPANLDRLPEDGSMQDIFFHYEESKALANGAIRSPSIKKYKEISEMVSPLKAVDSSLIKKAFAEFHRLSGKLLNDLISTASAEDIQRTSAEIEADLKEKKDRFYGIIAGTVVVAGAASAFLKFLRTPATIAILSAMSMGMAIYLAVAAKQMEEEAEENKKTMEQIIANFVTAVQDLCPDGRNDLGNPQCYCYLEGGRKNPGRSNSETCQQLWAINDSSLAVSETDYGSRLKRKIRGCVMINGQFDRNCKCRRLIDSRTKQNACRKAPPMPSYFKSMGNAIGTQSAVNTLNNTFQGNYDTGNLSQSNWARYAANIDKTKDQLLKKTNEKFKKEGKPTLKLDKKSLDKFRDKVITPKMLEEAKKKLSALDTSRTLSRRRPSKGAMGKAMKKALKKTGLDKLKYSKSKKLKKGKGKKKKKFAFNFNDEAGNKPKVQTFDVMDKKFKFKENDIVNNKDVPIWKIITNRYNSSGYRRLFGDSLE